MVKYKYFHTNVLILIKKYKIGADNYVKLCHILLSGWPQLWLSIMLKKKYKYFHTNVLILIKIGTKIWQKYDKNIDLTREGTDIEKEEYNKVKV
mgnify:CR=1 FL=1